jgi:hypothetical protein
MKKKAPAYIIGGIMFVLPFYTAYLAPSSHNVINLGSFLSVLGGALILIVFGSSDGQTHLEG